MPVEVIVELVVEVVEDAIRLLLIHLMLWKNGMRLLLMLMLLNGNFSVEVVVVLVVERETCFHLRVAVVEVADAVEMAPIVVAAIFVVVGDVVVAVVDYYYYSVLYELRHSLVILTETSYYE